MLVFPKKLNYTNPTFPLVYTCRQHTRLYCSPSSTNKNPNPSSHSHPPPHPQPPSFHIASACPPIRHTQHTHALNHPVPLFRSEQPATGANGGDARRRTAPATGVAGSASTPVTFVRFCSRS
ncbi:hypothetical protein Hanom_Chr01g00027881 [Helianthus anomalus]